MSRQHRIHKHPVPSTRSCPHRAVVAIRPGVGQCLECGCPCPIPGWLHAHTRRP